MQTVDVPNESWPQTLNEFTSTHEGWLVSLDVLNPEMGAQPEISELPLVGIWADQIDHDRSITVSAARSAGEHISHTIRDARRVQIERTDEGADAALAVESGDGTKTILRFRSAGRPDVIDGFVAP